MSERKLNILGNIQNWRDCALVKINDRGHAA